MRSSTTGTLPLPPDPEIVAGLGSGDSGMLERLMRTFQQPLTRYAESILDGAGDGCDVVQEVFIRLWTRRSLLDTKGSIRSLLYTMTRHLAVDERRRRRRMERRAAMYDPPTSAESPFDGTVEGELMERAATAVARLPARRQEVFRLVREGNLSYEEVASVMGISSQTVANHMSLALASLREALAPALGWEPSQRPSGRKRRSTGLRPGSLLQRLPIGDW